MKRVSSVFTYRFQNKADTGLISPLIIWSFFTQLESHIKIYHTHNALLTLKITICRIRLSVGTTRSITLTSLPGQFSQITGLSDFFFLLNLPGNFIQCITIEQLLCRRAVLGTLGGGTLLASMVPLSMEFTIQNEFLMPGRMGFSAKCPEQTGGVVGGFCFGRRPLRKQLQNTRELPQELNRGEGKGYRRSISKILP